MITIGASSGGVEALSTLVGGLPADLPAAVLVVLHFPQEAPSALPRILGRAGPLEAFHPEDGDRLEGGRVYVAPPGLHLLVEDGRVRLARGPKENGHRPAVDPLFRTAALAYGPRAVGVVLTGADDDGTAGLVAIKRMGGVAVVQDPDDALFRPMPESALRHVDVDYCAPVGEMAPLLARLVRGPAEKVGAYTAPEDLVLEAKISGLEPSVIEGGRHPGKLSGFTCPECSGPLYGIEDGPLTRFRCRVGHAYTAEAVLEGKNGALEEALYAALNALEEAAEMAEKLAARAQSGGQPRASERFQARARKSREQATKIRRVMTEG
ncbi:chemotaxis protein CheB [Rubrobacter tropicus]|uniref:chemotaxis protein CheB n=1 Tax=Rubrobacter tropicus TaxID=2653851 RepID=UPI00140CCDC2|nr:chemotaxis protein CheB [Rubrobacter tropicus]